MALSFSDYQSGGSKSNVAQRVEAQNSQHSIGGGSKGKLFGTLDEWLFGGSDSSAEGLQRKQNQLAREHATSERKAVEAFNKSEAQINRDFQERMANTSYQRAIKDMQAAGLNPMLAFEQGGAAAPQGSTASSSSKASDANAAGNTSGAGFLKFLAAIVGSVISSSNTAMIANTKTAGNMAKIATAQAMTGTKANSAKNPDWISKYLKELENMG